jgi:23S rRNA-intervening sequence protein
MGWSYRDLIVWQKATVLVTEIYRATQGFPRKEMFGLTSQLRRSAVSVASNIAEGQGRISKGEFRQFLGPCQGFSGRDGNSVGDRGKLGLFALQVGRWLDGPLGRSEPPSTWTHNPFNRLRSLQEPETRNRKLETETRNCFLLNLSILYG